MQTFIRLILVLALFIGSGTGKPQDQAAIDLEAAIRTETIVGDLPKAIDQYRVLAESSNRTIAAEALLRIGGAYEKLGSLEARNAYAKLLDEYADQTELAREAQLRLNALSDDEVEVADSSGPTIHRVWDGPGEFPYFGRVSRDGRYYAYAVWSENRTGNLAVRDLETGKTRVLTANEVPSGLPYYALISPDNREVAYVWWHSPGNVDLRIIGLDGSGERVVHDGFEGWPEVFDWTRDGSMILAAVQKPDGTGQVVLLSPLDGSIRALKNLGWRWPTNMSFSPDGRFIAYDMESASGTRERDIFVLAADGSREVALATGPADDHLPFWTPDGLGVAFASDRTGDVDMWRMDVVDGHPMGVAELIQRGLPYDPRGLSVDGDYFYLSEANARDVYLATLDESGRILDEARSLSPGSVGRVGAFDWSPDGRSLVYTVRSRGSRNAGGEQLIVRDLEAGQERDVMPDALAFVNVPVVAPDGRQILVYATTKRGRQGIYVIEDQTVRRVAPFDTRPLGWSRDGQFVYGFDTNPDGSLLFAIDVESGERVEVVKLVGYGGEARLRVRDPKTGVEREVLQGGERSLRGISPPAVSPDGRYLAHVVGDGSDRHTLIIIPIASGDVREFDLSGTATLGPPVWTPDSSGLFFTQNEDDGMRSVWRLSLDDGVREPVGLLMGGLEDIRLHPDGRRLMFAAGSESDFELWVMEDFLR